MINNLLNKLQPSSDVQYIVCLIALCFSIWLLRPVAFKYLPFLISKKTKLEEEETANKDNCECSQVTTLNEMRENLENLAEAVGEIKVGQSELRASLLASGQRQDQLEKQVDSINSKLDKVIDHIIDLSGKVGR